MSFITGLAATAMTIAVMAMFIVISIFSGLEELNKELINNIHADLTIKSKEGKLLKNPEEIISVLEKEPEIKAFSKVIEENKSYYRNFIGQKMAKQVRAIPQLNFYLDTSLDDVEKLERELKGLGDNPIL